MNENNRILIVDDNVSLHEDFRKILCRDYSPIKERLDDQKAILFGGKAQTSKTLDVRFELDFALQGEEACAKAIKALENKKPYALVFIDVRMPPGWDGVKTTAKIWEKVPFTEVVICSAHSDYSLDDMVEKLGVTHRLLFLKKPFDSVEVQQMALSLTKKWNLEESNRCYTKT